MTCPEENAPVEVLAAVNRKFAGVHNRLGQNA
jgi:hypothetical protein